MLRSRRAQKLGTSTSAGKNSWTVPGVLRIGSAEEPDSLNLMFGHTIATAQIDCLVFSFILRTDANGNMFPDLATGGADDAKRRN